MPKQDTASLLLAAKHRDSTGVYRFANGIPVNLTPENAGTWSTAPDGKRTWRLSVSSPGAVSLNLGFQRYRMPAGGRMVIYPQSAGASSAAAREFTDKDNEEHGQLWTPLFDGGDVVIEIDVPAGKEQELDIALTRVNHGFRRIAKVSEKTAEKIGDSATSGCEIDVACSAATLPGLGALIDAQRDQISAVGAFTLNGIDTCSGALINNTAQDGRPFFLTANHCGITAGNAPSMVVYWNFQNSSCRTPGCCGSDKAGDGTLNQYNTGAIFRAAYAVSDFALVEMDDPVDPAAKAFFAGWDRSSAQATSSSCIHHPALAEKRISFSFGSTTTTTWGGTSSPGDGSHARLTWTHGVTEPGSSGSPLFDQNLRIIGQLHGGDSQCGGTGADWFGRISKSWEGGGTDATRLKNWLDPLATAPPTLDGRKASPMLTIADASVAEGNAGTSTITLTVTLEPAASQMVSVGYSTVADIATIPADLASSSGTLTFIPGQLSQTISVAINGDTAAETDERFIVQLSSATNAGIYRAEASGYILNDDYLPPVIDSPLSASAFAGRPFTYTIHGTNTPRTFALGGTPPAGMTVNSSTGVITWTPPGTGTYNVQIVAANPAGSDTKTLQIQAAFGAVDLSAGLPPVADQGTLDASAAFAVAYYYKSFQEAKEHNWSLADPAHQFSPTFLHNQTNDFAGYTASIDELLTLIEERGCAPLSVAPYTPASTSAWPSYEATLAALPYRSAGHHAIGGGGTPELIDRMRVQLDSGDICLLEFDRWRPGKDSKGTFENLNASNHHYNLPLPNEVASGGLQSVAVVGYDDSQFNGRGGFKVVASFGSSWGNQGFAWLSYDFVNIFGYGVYVMEDRIGYTPAGTARISFKHWEFNPDHVTVTIGTGPDAAPQWSKLLLEGDRMLREYFEPDMAFDLTDSAGFLPPAPNQKWWVKIYDARTEDVITLNRFEVTTGVTTQSAAQVMPLLGSDFSGTVTAYIPAGNNGASQYFVNDGSTSADVYTTAPGSDSNDGLTVATPKATIQSVIDTYTLKAGDSVWVDAGTYSATTAFDQHDRGSSENPIRIVGALRPNGEPAAIIDFTGNTTANVFFFSEAAQNVRLENLWIKGGRNGVNASNDWQYLSSENIILRNLRISGTSGAACYFYENSPTTIENCLFYGMGGSDGAGVVIRMSDATISQTTIHAATGRVPVSVSSSSGYYASGASLDLNHSILSGSGASVALVSVTNYGTLSSAKNNVLYAGNGATVGFTPDATNVLADPLFANAAGGDYHEQSTAGRWDPAANAGAGGWVTDAAASPAIDVGDVLQSVGSEPAPNGGRLNAGAFGGTASASKSHLSSRYLAITSPSASSIYHESVTITWAAPGDGWLSGDTVRIEYTTDGGVNWTAVPGAGAVAYGAGTFVWNLVGVPDGASYQVRVVANPDAAVSSSIPGTFSVHYPRFYYVNDASQAGDVYCTGAGNVANNGLSAATPKDSVQAILDAYDLEGGDVIHVDTGNYLLSATLTVVGTDSGDATNPVRIVGSTTWGGTVLDRNNTGSDAVYLSGCSHVRLENLWITRGYRGVVMSGGAQNCRVWGCRVYKNSQAGLYFSGYGSGTSLCRVEQCLVDRNGSYGVECYYADDISVLNSTLMGHAISELSFEYSANNEVLRNNIIWSNGSGRKAVSVDTSNANVSSSDYNDFVITNGAVLSNMGATLPVWQAYSGMDSHSLSTDPLFVDADGPDNIAGNADDDFHLQSTAGSWHGGAFTADAADSPAIDAGDPSTLVGVESTPNGNRVNLGAFGGTVQASRTPAGRVLALVTPNGGEVRAGANEIRWQASGTGWGAGDTVRLEYSLDNGATWQAVTGAGALAYNLGSFTWSSTLAGSSPVARVRVISNQNGTIADTSDNYFVLHNGPISYYVNDASQTGDVYCTAAGSAANNGLSAATPKDSVQAILDTYDLEGGDVIYLDSGSYALGATLSISSGDNGDAAAPVRIIGSTTWGATLLDRVNNGGDVVTLSGCRHVWLENLWVTRGSRGVYFTGATENCRLTGCRIFKNQSTGVYFVAYGSGNEMSVMVQNCLIDRNGATGIYVYYSDDVSVVNSTLFGHTDYEIQFGYAGRLTALRNNIIWSEGAGNYAITGSTGNSNNVSNSDYNNFITTNGAGVASFDGTYTSLTAWATARGSDSHSISTNPLFVDADGPDNIAGNADDDFHLQSTAGSWHGGAFTADAADSPAIDAGDPSAPVGAETAPNGNRIDLGAFGGTPQASRTPAGRVLALITPNGGEVRAGANEIRWQTTGAGWQTGDTVRLEYSLDNGATWQGIAGASTLGYALGNFSWDSTLVAASAVARVRVISNQNGAVADGSDGYFLLHNGPISYYVNDASQTGDVYTAAAGSAANDGLSAATPKNSVQAVLDTYDLEGGDVIYVDTGNYLLSATLTVGSADGGEAANPVRIVGSTTWGGTVLDRVSNAGTAIALSGCAHTWLENLWVTRGSTGVSFSGSTENCRLIGCRVFKNQSIGIYFSAYGYGAAMSVVVQNCLIDRNGATGLWIYYSDQVSLLNSTLYGHTDNEIQFAYSGRLAALRNNIVWSDGAGNYAISGSTSNNNYVLNSDYNNFVTTNGAGVASFSGIYMSLSSWAAANNSDAHSNSTNPLFVDADGPDNIAGNADDDFHLQSTAGSWHGGVFTADAADSPAIDAGDPSTPVGSETAPNGNRVNLGAFGGTAQASRSVATLVLLAPSTGSTSVAQVSIQWLATWPGLLPTDTVNLEYSTDGQNWLPVAGGSAVAANAGQFAWNVAGLAYGTTYRVRVVSNQPPLVVAESGVFSLGGSYYVNDGSTTGDVFTSAPGNDANDGMTPATPKATLEAILSAYDLRPGDLVLVDAGNYSPAAAINIAAEDGGSSAGMVRIRGVKGKTVIDQGINLAAPFVALEDLWLRSGSNGVYITADDCTVQGCRISECGSSAIYAWMADRTSISNNMIQHAGTEGAIYLRAYYYQGYYGLPVTVRNNTIVTTGATGIYARVSDGPVITNNIIAVSGSNRYAIDASPRYYSITLTSDYNVLHATNGAQIGNYYDQFQTASLDQWKALIGWELHSIAADPQFANAATGDYHVKSRGGRFDPSFGLPAGNPGAWVVDATTSPAVDGGDPATPVGTETAFNGGRINAGADGGTDEASRSVNAGRNVEIVSPAGGESLEGYARVEWRSAGPDWQTDDTVRLEYSPDAGATWFTVDGAANLPWMATQHYWNTAAVTNGYGYRLRMVHVQTTTAIGVPSGLFAVSNGAGLDWNLYVSSGGVDDAFHGTQAMPFKTIGYAIDTAQGQAGTHVNIHVAAGTYTGNVTLKSYVNLLGGYSAADWTRNISANVTTLDAQGSGSVVTGANDALIEGFTITGGNAGNGGGVYSPDSTVSFVIRYCQIINNTATTYGGGIYAGGGPTIVSCIIAGNQAQYGDGVDVGSTRAQVRNCTIVNNGGHGVYGSSTNPKIANCIIWNNGDDLFGVTTAYSNVEDSDAGTGVIHLNPLLDANYRLTGNSPCINKGANLEAYQMWLDMDGKPRVRHGIVDIGASEFDQLVAFPASVTINEDTPVSGTLTGSDVNGGTITFAKVAEPTKGVAVVNPDGSYTYTPNSNVNGTDSFTFKVNNGVADSNETTVSITINAVNDAPTVTDIADLSINEDANTGAIPFTIGDAETAVASLALTRSSSNTTLVPTANVLLGGSGANRTITVTPVANLSGTTTITVSVSDGTLTTSDTFVVTVNAVNDAPTISNITDRTINEDANTGAVAVTVGDIETPVASLTLAGTSSNQVLVPDANIVFGGSGASRTVTVTPLANQNGTATITVTASDGTASTSDTFLLTVTAVNDAPTISNILDLAINEDSSTGPLAFTIGDVETAPDLLTVTRSSSNTTLVPTANIVLGGTDVNRTVTVTPAPNQSGTATITVTVSDGTASANDTFLLTVTAVNDAPTITDITDRTINEDASTGTVAFTIGDVETSAASLTVTRSSSDTTLIPLANVVLGGSGANRTVTVTPVANLSGTATITVSVSDGTASASDTFLVTVTSVNDAPAFVKGANQTVNEDAGPQTAAGWATSITAGPSESLQAVNFLVSSNNPGLFSAGPAVLSNGTLTYTPAANANGGATVTVQIHDDGGTLGGGVDTSAAQTFTVTVNAVNDAPAISDISNQSISNTGTTGSIPFTIGDIESTAASLTVSGSSNNTALIPNANIIFGGSGANRTVALANAPSQTGTATITVTVSDGALTASDTFDVTVNAPEIAVEQPAGTNIADGGSKNFGFVLLGSGNALSFTIKNTGNADLTGLGITIDGANASDFTVTANPTAPVSGPFGNTTFTVRFTPTSVGPKTAALHIASNDADENPFDIALSGTGMSADLAALVPGSGTLSPAFASSTTSYTVSVPTATTSITVTPTVFDSSATSQVNGVSVASGTPSGPISLLMGSNTVSTVVTARDGVTTKTYTVVVRRGDTKAQITNPTNGSTLTSQSLALVWNSGVGVSQYILYAGTTAGGYDLYAAVETGFTRTITVPADRKIHVTLFSKIGSAYLPNYYVFNPLPSIKAALASPADSSTLIGNTLALTWNAGIGASKYVIWIGSSPGGYDLGAADAGTALSRTFTVPQDGGPVYVTLWSVINGAYQSNSYWFTTALPVSGNRPASITSPANASALGSGSLSLAWDAGVGATSYALWVGSKADGYDLYAGAEGANTAKTVAIPGDGRRIFVTLHSLIGGVYQSNAYYFTAPNLPDKGAAQITTPAIGSTLASASLPLAWSSAAGASQYILWAGDAPMGYNRYAGAEGLNLSKTITTMPLDGSPVYATLYSLINGAYLPSTAWFTTANTGGGNKRARVTSPGNGSVLTGSQTFTWDAGTGVTGCALWIGSSPSSYDLLAAAVSPNSNRTVTLPTDGRKIYVTLHSLIGGAYQSNGWFFTAANVAAVKGAITSPVNGSVLSGSSVTFNWSAAPGATLYVLYVGRKPGGYDVYAGAEGLNTSKTLTTLPTDGGPVYVTLYSLINGVYQSSESIYQAALPP